jgi:hypothetical protein
MEIPYIVFNLDEAIAVSPAVFDGKWFFVQDSYSAMWTLDEAIAWLTSHPTAQCKFDSLDGAVVSAHTALQILTAEAGLKHDQRHLVIAGHVRVA